MVKDVTIVWKDANSTTFLLENFVKTIKMVDMARIQKQKPETTLNSMPVTHKKPLDARCEIGLDTNGTDVKTEPLPESKMKSNIVMQISYKLEDKACQNKPLDRKLVLYCEILPSNDRKLVETTTSLSGQK